MPLAANSIYPDLTSPATGCFEVPPSLDLIHSARLAEASFASTKSHFDFSPHDQDPLKTMPAPANAWLLNDMFDAAVFPTNARPIAVGDDDGQADRAQNAFLGDYLKSFHEADDQQTLPHQNSFPKTSGPSRPQPATPAPPRHAHNFSLRLRRDAAAPRPSAKATVSTTCDKPRNLPTRMVHWLLFGAGSFATLAVLSAASGFFSPAGFHLAGCYGCLMATYLNDKFSMFSELPDCP